MVSALFRWPCSISIHHLSPRSVTCGVRPFPLAMQHFYSFVSQVCHCWCPPFSAGFSAGHVAGLSLVLPPFSAGHVACLFTCLPCDFFLFAARVFSALSAGTGSPVKGSCYFERGACRDCIPATLCNSLSFVFLFTAGVRPFPLAM